MVADTKDVLDYQPVNQTSTAETVTVAENGHYLRAELARRDEANDTDSTPHQEDPE